MAYTEIKEKNGRKYYYRVKSIREGKMFKKQRIYLGKNLLRRELILKENLADESLNCRKKEDSLNNLILKIRRILRKNKIKRAGIFGSYSVGKQKEGSDIDILVEPPKDMGIGFVKLQFDLEDKLKRKVDLVSYNGLSPHLRDKILSQEIRVI